MAQFAIDSRMKGLPDPQTQYMWELLIPNIGDLVQDDILLRCQTATIPSRGNQPMESMFMGMKQHFSGQPLFSHTLITEFEEREDQVVLTSLNSWQDLVFDIDPNSNTSGQSKVTGKQDYTRDIKLVMYKKNGEPLPYSVVFYNAFIENIDDSALGYANNESVKYSATFRFDYWLPKRN
jgi:hypothetical protein